MGVRLNFRTNWELFNLWWLHSKSRSEAWVQDINVFSTLFKTMASYSWTIRKMSKINLPSNNKISEQHLENLVHFPYFNYGTDQHLQCTRITFGQLRKKSIWRSRPQTWCKTLSLPGSSDPCFTICFWDQQPSHQGTGKKTLQCHLYKILQFIWRIMSVSAPRPTSTVLML